MFSSSTLKKCRLCSRLSSRLKQFIDRFVRRGLDCYGINQTASQNPEERALSISRAAPDCSCEKYRMSRSSRGVVADHETLSRFVFLPMHVNNRGDKVKPTFFEHVHKRGCSIQRESIALTVELTSFVADFLKVSDDRGWIGVLSAGCKAVRDVRIEARSERALCVYDTAKPMNPAHAEMFIARRCEMEADNGELRFHLRTAFNDGKIVSAPEYRAGAVWGELSVAHQAVSREGIVKLGSPLYLGPSTSESKRN